MTTPTRITSEGSEYIPHDVVREALKFKNRVENTKTHLGIDSINKSTQLPGGEQVYVVSNKFISRVHIISTEPSSYPVTTPPEVGTAAITCTRVGDFVCGVVTGTGMTETVETRTNLTTGDTKDLNVYMLTGVKQTESSLMRYTDREARIKLAVEPDVAHQPLTTPPNPVSQHAYIKPSMYTGYMRAVVQLLLGVGFVGPQTYEHKWVEDTGEQFISAIDPDDPDSRVVSGFGLPKKWDEIGYKVQVKYDYRFETSHGLGWGARSEGEAGNICYLIQIGRSGVYAMPLPLDPVSKTPQGRERYVTLFPELEEMDDWGECLIDRLGGFPTGESFPRIPSVLQEYVRAGEVVQLLDSEGMRPFYEGTFTSSAFGWVFQPNGGRADNVCIKWKGNPGWQQGYHYSVTFSFNPFNAELDAPYPQHGGWLASSEEPYLHRKAARLTPEQYAELMNIEEYDDRLDHFKSMVVPSPFSGTAALQEKKHGDLYHPGKLVPLKCEQWSGQPQIKFPEPLLGGLVSFDFSAERGATPPERCDAPIAVIGENGGGVALINYTYRKNAPIGRTAWNTREYCQFEGSWESGSSTQGQREQGNFYTSHDDFRKKVDIDSYSKTTTTGTFVGYNYSMSFCAFFAMHSTMVTNVHHSYEWESESHGGQSYMASIAFPEGERNAYYVLEYETKSDDKKGKGVSAPSGSGTGPITRYGVIYHFVMHWAGHCAQPNGYVPGPKVSCRMKEYKEPTTGWSCFPDAPEPEWFEYEVAPFRGNWMNNYHQDAECTGNTSYLNAGYGPTFTGPSWSQYTDPCTTIKYRVRIFGDIEFSGATIMKDELTGKREGERPGTLRNVDFYDTLLSAWWFKPSPDNCSNTAHLNMVQSCWGNRITNYDDQVDGMKTKHYGSPHDLRSSTRATYVGYIR